MTEKTPPHDRFGLSEGYWASLSPREKALYEQVRPLRTATYKVDYHLNHIEDALNSFKKDAELRGGSLDLNPDFQRGHVWSRAKQVAYMENVFRNCAPMLLRFNCAGWDSLSDRSHGDLLGADIVCVDGLQRLTAIRQFMAGEFYVFCGETATTLRGTPFDPARTRISVEMFSIQNRVDLLQFYLDINRGGVVHTDEEIERVALLMADAKAGNWEKPKSTKKEEAVDSGAVESTDAQADATPPAKKVAAKKTAKTRLR